MYEQPYQGSRYLGLSINGNYPMSERYLSSAHTVYLNALNTYSRVMMFHVTLRLPDSFSASTNGLMSSFTTSLKKRIQRNLERRRQQVSRVHHSNLHYVWCREVSGAHKRHFHVMLLVNGNAYRALGAFDSFEPHCLTGMVNCAWASALKLSHEQIKGFAHFTPSAVLIETQQIPSSLGHSLYGQFADNYEAGFHWLSYLCKLDTKEYGDGQRNFGCSSSSI